MMKRILVVDDEASVLKITALMLKLSGYEVLTAQNGEEGVALASEEKPDLILLDIRMPKMNGFDAFKKIRSGKGTQHIPVIYSTADASISFDTLPEDLRADDVLLKPYAADDLSKKIRQYLA